MAINIDDPRVSFDGKRFLVDGIPIRLWAKNLGVSYGSINNLQSKGKSITEIENMYKNKKQLVMQKRLISFMGKEYTIPELFNNKMRHESVSVTALRLRLVQRKWDVVRALTEPVQMRKGIKVCYKGKTYPSVAAVCSELRLDEQYVRRLLREGESLEDAINQAFNITPFYVVYKGKQMQITELVRHPDNIHKLDYFLLYSRIKVLGYSPKEALASRATPVLKEKIIYKGKEYKNKIDLCRALNLSTVAYQELNGIDANTDEFNDLIDKMVQDTNKHSTLK